MEAVKLDKEAAALLRKANALLLRGPSKAGCELLRQAMAKYERIPSLDPEVGPNAEMIVGFIAVGLAECLIGLPSSSDQEEAKRLAQAAIPPLQQAQRRGADKCHKYLERAHRILSDQPTGRPAPLKVELIQGNRQALSPRIWAAIIAAIAVILAAVIGALLRR